MTIGCSGVTIQAADAPYWDTAVLLLLMVMYPTLVEVEGFGSTA